VRSDVAIEHVADPNQASTVLNISIKKPGWIIRSVVIFNETLFEAGGSLALHPPTPTAQVLIPLKTEKNQELLLDLRIMVGTAANSSHFLVFNEPRFVFKRFAMLRYLNQDQKLLLDKPAS